MHPPTPGDVEDKDTTSRALCTVGTVQHSMVGTDKIVASTRATWLDPTFDDLEPKKTIVVTTRAKS